nr:heavy metal-associated isoprenylated plant protein 47-like [Ipomoea batatas]
MPIQSLYHCCPGIRFYLEPQPPLFKPQSMELSCLQRLKIVIQLYPRCQKCRSKALSIAAEANGVSRVEIERDKVVVIGEDIDAAGLTSLIRKKIGNATLEFVQAA